MNRASVRWLRLVSIALGLWSLAVCGDGSTGPSGNSPFQGEWTFEISGEAFGSGACQIDSDGRLAFNLDFIADGSVYQQAISGTVNGNGDLSATVRYQGSQIGTASGRLVGNSGSGTWQTSLAGSGTWTATKVDPAALANRPTIVRITFPPQIPATPVRIDGTVEFTDPNGDVTRVYFDVASTTGSTFIPFDFNPGVQGITSGSFSFNIGCNGPGLCTGTTVLSVTLQDSQSNRSQPALLTFSYQ